MDGMDGMACMNVKFVDEQAAKVQPGMPPWIKMQHSTFLNWFNMMLDKAKVAPLAALDTDERMKDGTASALASIAWLDSSACMQPTKRSHT